MNVVNSAVSVCRKDAVVVVTIVAMETTDNDDSFLCFDFCTDKDVLPDPITMDLRAHS